MGLLVNLEVDLKVSYATRSGDCYLPHNMIFRSK